MKIQFWVTRTWLFVLSLAFLGVTEAMAEVKLTDNLAVAGYLRQELAVHTGEKNPTPGPWTTAERNSLNLSRTFFQTEWMYNPNDTFKVFSKVKMLYDQTAALDDKLNDYNAFPLATPRYGGYLRATNDNNIDVEMSELYADASLGNLWLRLGKQQIVWGELIAARILDQINPLDLSWHLTFEPEEFENIRMAQWALRARYNVTGVTTSWLDDIYLEGFLNPGDIAPTVTGAPGSPFQLAPASAAPIKDRRSDMEYGFRLGGRIGQVAGTLNYLNLYSDSGFLESGFTTYPNTELYGISLNYALPKPFNTTLTYEATYSHDEPYYDSAPGAPRIRLAHTLKQAILFGQSAFILPQPISAMSIQFQYSETQIWDHNRLKTTPAPLTNGVNNVSADQHVLALILSQDLLHNNLNLYFQVVYDLAGAQLIKPGIKVRQGNHWIYDIYGVAIGGSETRSSRLGYLSWANEIFGRITYQF